MRTLILLCVLLTGSIAVRAQQKEAYSDTVKTVRNCYVKSYLPRLGLINVENANKPKMTDDNSVDWTAYYRIRGEINHARDKIKKHLAPYIRKEMSFTKDDEISADIWADTTGKPAWVSLYYPMKLDSVIPIEAIEKLEEDILQNTRFKLRITDKEAREGVYTPAGQDPYTIYLQRWQKELYPE